MGILSVLGTITNNPVAKRLIDLFIPDKASAREFQLELSKLEAEQNKIRAQALSEMMGHKSVFVAGAIPSFLWIGAIGIFLMFIVNPILAFAGIERELYVELPAEYWSLAQLIIGGLFAKKVIDDNEWNWGGKIVSPSKKKIEFEIHEGFKTKTDVDYNERIKELEKQYGLAQEGE